MPGYTKTPQKGLNQAYEGFQSGEKRGCQILFGS